MRIPVGKILSIGRRKIAKLTGYWSRRVNDKDRLIYRTDEKFKHLENEIRMLFLMQKNCSILPILLSYHKPRTASVEQRERERQMMIEWNKAKEDQAKSNGIASALVVK